jgi:hypothetical protein
MTTLRGFPIVLLGFLAVVLVLGGLSVEAFTRSEVTRAQRALPGALARTVVAKGVAPETLEAVAETRRHVRRRRLAQAAEKLEALIGEVPTAEMHGLVATAYQAADRGVPAARHAQLAARLAPDDGPLQDRAERAVDVALAYRARPWTRVAGGLGLLVAILLAMRGLRARRIRRHLQRFLDGVTGRVAFTVDGEPRGSTARLRSHNEALTIDVFLKGRHGMACPPRPARAPTLHVSLSHAGASRTVRLTPVKRLRDKAVRIPVRAETLRRIMDVPGRWRVHARLGPRPVASAILEVRTAQPATSRTRSGTAL